MESIKWYLKILFPKISEENSEEERQIIREYRRSLILPIIALIVSMYALLNRIIGL